jgi:fructose-bisphosphate aldolase, class II
MLTNMKDLLAVAHANHFAVPAFNISNNMLLSGVIEASEEANAPVILAIHPDELAFTRPAFIKTVIEEATKTSIPVCIHLDHGSTIKQIMEAIQYGFTSVMIDASTQPLEQNIAISKQVVELAHLVNVSVEGELGTIGTTGTGAEAGAEEIIYVNPDDVETFVQGTGVDTLAVAVGTAHGIYPKGKKPELKLELLKEITSRVDIPLVLHGGSANPDEEIARAVKLGINKINISSDIKNAFYQKAREVLSDLSLYEPLNIYPSCIAAMKKVAHHKIDLFDATGKAALY